MNNELPPHIKLGIDKEQWDMKQQAAKSSKQTETETELTDVKIVGINIPFMDLVSLLVKLAIAAIPAMIVVSFFWAAIAGLITGLIGSQ
jgi:uncharacterized oligopeptide transporter (OPT) family protein